MEHFILNYSWFVLNYVFRYFGVNPCEKDEFDNLKPTSFCRYWFRYFFTHILVLSGYIGSIFAMCFIESTPKMFEEAWREAIARSTITAAAVTINEDASILVNRAMHRRMHVHLAYTCSYSEFQTR